MGRLRFEVAEVGFEELRKYGDFAILTKLAQEGAESLGYPLLTKEDADHVSNSGFLDRSAAAAVVRELNPHLPAPSADARYVVGGQQAGLLTGPLYTFLKGITAVNLSRELSRLTDSVVLPLFWIASEDHDVLEVNRFVLCDRRFVHPYKGTVKRGLVPQVADISIRDAREPMLEFLRAVLPRSEFSSWVLSLVSEADYTSYAAAFRDIMRSLFREWGLRLVDPISLRELTAPVLASLVQRWPELEAALVRGADTLRKHGIDPPLSGIRIFEVVEGNRVAVEAGADRLRFSDGECSYEEAADRIRQDPHRFSPGAALRPICQDAVLPTVATLGGPSELKYLWQILPLYSAFGIGASLRFPRVSATFLGPSVRRVARNANLLLEHIFQAPMLLEGTRRVAPDSRGSAIERKGQELLDAIDELEYSETPRWLRTSRTAIESGVARIVSRLNQEKMDAEGATRQRLQRIADAIAPGGKLQERVVNVFQFLNLHGPEWIERAVETLDPFPLRHRVVAIEELRGVEAQRATVE